MSILDNAPPGITAVINSSNAGGPIARQPTSNAFIVPYSGWGPVGRAQVVSSWQDAVRMYGGFNSNSPGMDALYSYFTHHGGLNAIVSRAVGPTPVVATATLHDRAGSPLATVRVDAIYPSSSVDISVQTLAGTNTGVKYIFKSVALNITEVYDNKTLSAADIQSINDTSKLVKLTNLNSATAGPNNLPAIAGPTALAGGDDDFADITDTQYTNALSAFADFGLGGGQVAIPGKTSSAVLAAIKTHAENFKRLAIGDAPLGDDLSTILALDTTAWRSGYHWFMYLWEQATRFDGVAGLKYYPPSIAGLGACARVDRERGPHRSPANFGTVPYALDVERNSDGSPILNDAARLSLDNKQICPVVPLGGQGIKIYGDVLHQTTDAVTTTVPQRRTLNFIYYSVALSLAWAPFEPANERLFRQLASVTTSFMDGLWRDGALFGSTAKEAYTVICDRSNNSDDQIALRGVRVDVAAKITQSADKVAISITPAPLGADLSLIGR